MGAESSSAFEHAPNAFRERVVRLEERAALLERTVVLLEGELRAIRSALDDVSLTTQRIHVALQERDNIARRTASILVAVLVAGVVVGFVLDRLGLPFPF